MLYATVQNNIIYANHLKVGFIVRDEDGDHINLSGVTSRRVKRGYSGLWLLKNIARFFPQCREYQIQKAQQERQQKQPIGRSQQLRVRATVRNFEVIEMHKR